MSQFTDLAQPKGLGKLNGFLNNVSYISGYAPSQADAKLYAELASLYDKGPDAKFVNVRRWWDLINSYTKEEQAAFPEPTAEEGKAAEEVEEEESDDDLFGSDSDDDAAAEEARKALADKNKAKKKKAQKSNIIFDVKPYEAETDMAELEKLVRAIAKEGLSWGPSKLVPVAYGVKKLQITCVVEDEKIELEDLEETIKDIGDGEQVQSVDVAAMVRVG
eukprot:TRINITY_DN1768_c0_g1_i1.p1 TRINITY_DN1768_c0_g1~~TRINITY_DN1768_c0_g1_i1.p1  ORF type:complete len:243 (+),score=78.32 TRINITY_DN1768_c0_g1_i1:75-731(+)